MKVRNFILTIATTLVTMAAAAQTDGFSYQAVVRNSNGDLVNNAHVGLRLTLTAGDNGQALYQETHRPSTNNYGVLNVTVGDGSHAQGTSIQDVDWSSGNVWMRVEVDPNGGTNYIDLGSTKLQSVPYAYYAANSSKGEKGDKGDPGEQGEPGPQGAPGRDGMQVEGQLGQTLVHNGETWVATDQISVKKLDVKAETVTEDALFEVKDKDGNVVFAVYPNGVYVYIDPEDNSKGADKVRRSGFFITGRDAAKNGKPNDFFAVNGDGTKVFVDTAANDKVRRSGFYITGRDAAKEGENTNFLTVDGKGTQVFVDDKEGNAKVRRSGFYITGRDAAKEGEATKYMTVNDEGTKVFINNTLDDSKARRSGFYITGRDAAKEGEATDYMKVATDGTLVHFDNDNSKVRRSGFYITGRDATKVGTTQEYMTINSDSTRFYINGGSAKGDFGVASLEDGSKADSGNGGFAVSGRDGSKGSAANNLFNIDLATTAKTLNEENRIYWYPERNAFMAGNLLVEHPDSVGTNSFNAGYQNKAIGEYSQAFGYKSVATGKTSIAIGNQAKATGKSSFSFGEQTTAIGESSVAIGRKANSVLKNAYALGDSAQAKGTGSYAFGSGAVAEGTGSFAFGSVGQDSLGNALNAPNASADFAYAIGAGTKASAKGAFATGVGTEAKGQYSVAMGNNTVASNFLSYAAGYEAKALGFASFSMGYQTTASGMFSVALGQKTTACSYGEVVVGQYNTTYTPSSIDWNSNDRQFVVGNGNVTFNERLGDFVETYSNALVVYKNGQSEFGGSVKPMTTNKYNLGTSAVLWKTVYATGGVQTTSDQRLKTNIKPLERALDKVLTLNGVTYDWRVMEFPEMHFDSDRHVGVIAQEVEAVLPEAVETGGDGYKSVNYSNITPLLIEAVKELKAEKDDLQKQVDELRKMVEELMKKQ